MKRSKLIVVVAAIIVFLFIFSISTAFSSTLNAAPPPSIADQQTPNDQITAAILAAIAGNSKYVQGGVSSSLKVLDIKTSSDQKLATAWIVYYDAQIDAVVPSEPGLAISHLVDGQWQVFLPSDTGWQDMLTSLPDDLLSTGEKDMYLAMSQGEAESLAAQSGYLLPWHGGQTAYLSRSVGHDADFTTAHFAFDFYLPGTTTCPSGTGLQSGTKGLGFNIYAAKAGTVWGWNDSITDCDHSAVNFIVLRNVDDPTLFQLYMHLAQNSIPPALKSVGAQVQRGQFIAVADNTGNSTGSHLHFQVEHQPTWPASNPYWNTALEITFDDVDINGGRPRVSPLDPPYCRSTDHCDVFRPTYTSGNYYLGDSTPPTGNLTGVSSGGVITTDKITLSGSGSDNQTGLDYGQLIGFFNGSWNNLGPQFKPSFTYTWDLCNAALPVPNGPVSVAMILYDVAGNTAPRAGLKHFIKNYSCPIPPPACVPGPNQVSIFQDAYYHGKCAVLNVGNYASFSAFTPVGNDEVESILVGTNVIATLYSESNFVGHSQAVSTNAEFMKYFWVPANTLTSMKVSLKTTAPLAPILVSPTTSTVFRQGDIIPLAWQNGGGALEYKVEVVKNSVVVRSLPWQSAPVAFLDSLDQGTYTWRVEGKFASTGGPWSQSFTFTVESPIVIPSAETVPYSDTMETTQAKWTASPSFWSYVNNSTKARSGTHSWWYQNSYGNYDNSSPNSGNLTSPPITIPGTGYYLRFYYRYQTETQGATWDQRWVQVSQDGGPFLNVTQLSDDIQLSETSSWLRNKAIDLSAYAGHSIRIRFQFSTLDATQNNLAGWGIDDLSITHNPPASCTDARQDDTPSQAFLLNYDPNITIPSEICPNGDIDYYKFYGNPGDRIVADVDAMKNGSLLDSFLFLLDSDGKTVLAENDDEVYSVRRDPLLSYTLPKAGMYYLKLRAWKHPLVGGDNYFYTIRLYEDHISPVASIAWPSGESFLPDSLVTFNATVTDVTNGINRVEFYWYSNDWMSGDWQNIGTDWDGADGWSVVFDPADQLEGRGAALFVQAYDMAGNWAGAAAWNLGIDKTPPVTELKPLGATQSSNAFQLEWTGTDNLSGIDYVEIKEKKNNGTWNTEPRILGTETSSWIISDPGNTYFYMMHGVDHSGNSENYPATAETSTSIPVADVLCFAPDTYDTSGNDNSPANASTIYPDQASQRHNFCNPLSADKTKDEDWIKFTAAQGVYYRIRSVPNSLPAAAIISLYAQDGTTLLHQTIPSGLGENTVMWWGSDRNQTVYIRIQNLDGRIIGNDVSTTISVVVTMVYRTFLTLVQR